MVFNNMSTKKIKKSLPTIKMDDKLITLINVANYRINVYFKDGNAISMSPNQIVKNVKMILVDFETLDPKIHWSYQY